LYPILLIIFGSKMYCCLDTLLLPSHAYKLNLNDSHFFSLHMEERICNLSHILFDCPSLSIKRQNLVTSLNPLNVPFNLHSIINSNFEHVIIIIISFIQEAVFINWVFLFVYSITFFVIYYLILFIIMLFFLSIYILIVYTLIYCKRWARFIIKS
jgi:hypothetical protein